MTYGTDYSTTPPTTLATATATSFDDDPQGSTVGGGHGTFVTATLAGNGTSNADPAGFFYNMGVVPSAGVKVSKINFTTGTSIFTLAHDARGSTPIAYVQNLSNNQYAGPNGACENPDGRYTIVSRDYDLAVRDSNGNPADGVTPILLVVSAGNQHQSGANPNCPGTDSPATLTQPPATAKNVLAVGATETPRASSQLWNCQKANAGTDGLMNVEFDSKRGTADLGWFKPDLMTPAANVSALRDDNYTQTTACLFFNVASTLPPNAFAVGTGTSYAAPIGTGASLLASRAYSQTPGAASPALVKAMLVMSARSMRGGKDYGDRDQFGNAKNPVTTIGAIPSQSQGFGRLSLETILKPYPARAFVNEGATATLAGVSSSWTNTYTVHDAGKPVIVVLTWTDAAGQISQDEFITNPLVNDLDLTVFRGSSCTQRYLGNHISATTEESLPEACSGSNLPFDRKNNVEVARFSGAAAGSSFTVTVKYETGTGTSSGGTQPFALAVWNAYDADDAAPPAPPTGVAATATSSTAISVTWNAVSGATGYDVRMWSGGPFWQTVATNQVGTTFGVSSLTPLTTYLFDVRARNASGVSIPSAPDGATTFPNGGALFTDDPLTAGSTVIKGVHVAELRQTVNAFRASAGLSPATFTDPTLNVGATSVKRLHIEELRTALDAARTALSLSALTYTDVSLAGVIVKAAHVQELRNAVK